MRNKGFTLLELSIVIVIIGLIVAGISAGQSLVQQASLRQLTTNINNYQVAINSFKLQYDAMPGDMDNATSYWPSASTADGNGDGNTNYDTGATPDEDTYAWQHLSLAGVVDGSYSGGVAGSLRYELGTNAADAGVGNAVMCIMYHPPAATLHYSTSGNSFQIGQPITTSNGHCNGGFISPPEAFAVDTKMDDGIGYTGFFYTFIAAEINATPNCMDAGVLATVTNYELDVTEPTCRVYYWLDKG